MTISLGKNIASLKSQRQLGQATGELRSVYERLSSGQRINRASDDAAGLAIANSLRTDARLYTQGIRNANDAISMHAIADAALGELGGIVTRIQELAEQSANGVYSNDQRLALDEEAQALRDEYQRIAETTEFNGVKLLDGSALGMQIQIGIDGQDAALLSVGFEDGATRLVGDGTFTLSQSIYSASANWFGLAIGDTNNDGFNDIVRSFANTSLLRTHLGSADGYFTTEVTTGSFTPFNRDILLQDLDHDGNLDAIGGADTQVMWGTGDGAFTHGGAQVSGATLVSIGDVNNDGLMDIVSASGTAPEVTLLINNGDRTFSSQVIATGAANTSSIALGDMNNDGNIDLLVQELGSTNNLNVYAGNGGGGFELLSTKSHNVGASGGVSYIADLNGDGNLDALVNYFNVTKVFTGDGEGNLTNTFTITQSPDYTPTVADFNDDGIGDFAGGDGVYFYNAEQETFIKTATIPLGGGGDSFSAAGDLNNDGVADLAIFDKADQEVRTYNQNTTTSTTLDPIDLTSQATSREALQRMQTRLDTLSSRRGDIGATLSRIEVAIRIQSVAHENFLAAESRIRDADVAVEGAALTRLNILQQAASSVLAQANQQPALAVQLLT